MDRILIVLALIVNFSLNFNGFNNQIAENGFYQRIDSVKKGYFIPDTSLNGKLYLHNASSIKAVFGDITPLLDHDADLPDVIFTNKSREEYIRMFVYPGSTKNCVDMFEVGYSSYFPIRGRQNSSNFISFETEHHIKLGMTQEEIINNKGKKYTSRKNGEIKIISYALNDFDKSDFLKKYNMPLYLIEFWFKKNKLVKFRFGFEYP
jgi:hypothetical protein